MIGYFRVTEKLTLKTTGINRIEFIKSMSEQDKPGEMVLGDMNIVLKWLHGFKVKAEGKDDGVKNDKEP